MKAKKRQHTHWIRRIWWQHYGNGSIKVGWIHNKSSGVWRDKIAVELRFIQPDGSVHRTRHNMRVDEASGLAAGICKVICVQSIRGRIHD